MWLTSPNELGLRPRSARPYQCTAEHLVAQQDGGKGVAGNVVAAHARCNQGRHKRLGQAPSPDAFRTLVMRRVARGKWWPQNLPFWHHQPIR
ncbi:HNH endonuclease [Xanthomonas campestris pv. campestris]|nr:HNH endonuclease [Xanthomonas campestris]MEB1040261.1 HNH endonuclease [Xanthomonas campestris pv. campestris]MEA9475875.1 HNH endonuclease [Xanthomonas campestris]MEB1160049.1 HNH endonuclease [Xanthomonas campestris pv. campestris]MEB1210078.1 HNH endonuclease [Xanthomonas campestris pv. campestris]MEB1214210.1 HNH endonuclease [Xanthomonas campestris pv. campestris]